MTDHAWPKFFHGHFQLLESGIHKDEFCIFVRMEYDEDTEDTSPEGLQKVDLAGSVLSVETFHRLNKKLPPGWKRGHG